eukprot:TRINITY_DN36911_c0_g2_i1.p2 TRINITY_DN36911_c0_g2~~TRINITY_DN36911_c0_g2_i1.p2  ORF type:complete len:121 (+),score=20.32 TRINITY_DN36911_c0_g2_i1:219-581(+)
MPLHATAVALFPFSGVLFKKLCGTKWATAFFRELLTLTKMFDLLFLKNLALPKIRVLMITMMAWLLATYAVDAPPQGQPELDRVLVLALARDRVRVVEASTPLRRSEIDLVLTSLVSRAP